MGVLSLQLTLSHKVNPNHPGGGHIVYAAIKYKIAYKAVKYQKIEKNMYSSSFVSSFIILLVEWWKSILSMSF